MVALSLSKGTYGARFDKLSTHVSPNISRERRERKVSATSVGSRSFLED